MQQATGTCPTASTPVKDYKILSPASVDGSVTLQFSIPGTVRLYIVPSNMYAQNMQCHFRGAAHKMLMHEYVFLYPRPTFSASSYIHCVATPTDEVKSMEPCRLYSPLREIRENSNRSRHGARAPACSIGWRVPLARTVTKVSLARTVCSDSGILADISREHC